MASEQKETLCECASWADTDPRYRLLTGHHVGCAKGPNGMEAAFKLIAALASGINDWAAECDGVPEELWQDWRRAMAIAGRFIADRPAT